VEFTCNYSEYEIIPQIYRSSTIELDGKCSPMFDYTSQQLVIGVENGQLKLRCGDKSTNVDADADRSTLHFVVYDDNPRVRTYINGDRVVGTMDKVDPRESWNPSMYGGYYYIGKDRYFMFGTPAEHKLGASSIPYAEEVQYTDGAMDRGVLVQKGTANLLLNTDFPIGNTMDDILNDTFDRT
jgi:hypothetical protein